MKERDMTTEAAVLKHLAAKGTAYGDLGFPTRVIFVYQRFGRAGAFARLKLMEEADLVSFFGAGRNRQVRLTEKGLKKAKG